MAGSTEMCDGFDQSKIHAERILDERFAVAGHSGRNDMYPVAAQLIQPGKLLADHIGRVALVGLVVVEQDLMILSDQYQFGGC